MSWRRRQSPHEQVTVKNCRHCSGSGRGHYGGLCRGCNGSGKAKTVYGFPKGWRLRKR